MRRGDAHKPDLRGHTPGTTVPVYLRRGLSGGIGEVLPVASGGSRLALVTDTTVLRLHGTRVLRGLVSVGWKVDTYKLAPGERIKTGRVVEKLHDQWLRCGYDRSTPVVAVGGGTIGDAVGFAAATFLRGLPLWHVPTTIVGQVDSSIGGKVGINHPRGKNLIGCFYQPAGIVIDPDVLTTLPPREVRSGLAEVIKYGVIADPVLFRHCEESIQSWISGSGVVDPGTIKRCVAIKLKVVSHDERDTGQRHILNFGHTLGHALEAWGEFRVFRHGEAVTLGMLAAAMIAAERGILPPHAFDRIRSICRLIAPLPRAARFEPAAVMPYLATDKKRAAGKNAWVLPTRIGKVTIVRDVTDKEIVAALGFVRRWLAGVK